MTIPLPPGVIKIHRLISIDFKDTPLWAEPEAEAQPEEGDQTVEGQKRPFPLRRQRDPSAPGSLAEMSLNLAAVQQAMKEKRPALIHFCVQGDTPRARVCQSLESDVFTVQSSNLQGADVSIGILARYFVCARVNVSEVAAEQTPLFNRVDAPAILIAHADGRTAEIYNTTLKRDTLQGGMGKTLQAAGLNVKKLLAEGKRLLADIDRLEYEQAFRQFTKDRAADPKAPRPDNLHMPRDPELSRLDDEALENAVQERQAAWDRLGQAGRDAKSKEPSKS